MQSDFLEEEEEEGLRPTLKKTRYSAASEMVRISPTIRAILSHLRQYGFYFFALWELKRPLRSWKAQNRCIVLYNTTTTQYGIPGKWVEAADGLYTVEGRKEGNYPLGAEKEVSLGRVWYRKQKSGGGGGRGNIQAWSDQCAHFLKFLLCYRYQRKEAKKFTDRWLMV